MHVILHHNDLDGVVANAVVSRHLIERLNIDEDQVKSCKVEYDRPLPDVPSHATVWFVDFHPPRAVLESMRKVMADVYVIDHHKSAKAEIGDMPDVTIDLEQSACGLAWRTLWSNRPIPPLVLHVEDRDLWRFKIEGTREVCAGLGVVELTNDEIVHGGVQLCAELASIGTHILKAQDRTVNELCGQAHEIELDERRVPSVNTPILASDVCSALLKRCGAPFVVCYHAIHDGRVRYELRSVPGGADVSEIAVRHGGGGHKHAAGFISDAPAHKIVKET